MRKFIVIVLTLLSVSLFVTAPAQAAQTRIRNYGSRLCLVVPGASDAMSVCRAGVRGAWLCCPWFCCACGGGCCGRGRSGSVTPKLPPFGRLTWRNGSRRG